MGEARVRMAAAVLGLVALGLASCADKLPVDASDHHTALPPAPTFSKPQSAPAAATPEPTPAAEAPPAPADTCGAADLAYLVGKPRTEIPIPADLTRRRVVCSTCPMTMDARPDRQTITYDGATNLVTKVACG